MIGEILDFFAGSKGGSDSVKKALQQFGNISLPQLKEINPELYAEVVALSPELQENVVLDESGLNAISLDPSLRSAQMEALNKLRNITDSDGMDAVFLNDANKLQQQINSNLRGNQDAITQNLAMRGMSGGMTELVQKQLAAQNAANQQSQMSSDLHASAQDRALKALIQQGDMASQMEQSQYGMAKDKAQANDAISRFNAEALMRTNAANVDAKNNANLWNAENKQSVANKNVETNNNAQLQNNQVKQAQFGNQMDLAKAKAGIYGSQADLEEERRKQNLGFVGGLINSGAKAFGGK